MIRYAFAVAATVALLAGPAVAASSSFAKEPPGGSYKQVSKLVKLPEFIPGIGKLYVDPDTLPAGPFLAYDKQGDLVSTIYMVPMKALDGHKKLDDLAASSQPVDHVDFYYNPGHPGVEEPHYHIVLWHVSEKAAEALK